MWLVQILHQSLKKSLKNREIEDGAYLLKCKKIFYITVDVSSFSAYNKSEKIEGGHHNEV